MQRNGFKNFGNSRKYYPYGQRKSNFRRNFNNRNGVVKNFINNNKRNNLMKRKGARKNFNRRYNEPRMGQIQRPAFRFRKNMLFLKGEKMKLFKTNEAITGDLSMDRDEMINKMITGLKDNKEIKLNNNITCIPQQQIDFELEVKDKKGKNTIEWLLTNYLLMILLPQNLQLLFAVLIDEVDYNLIEIEKQDKEKLIQNINDKRIMDNLNLAMKYVSKIQEQHQKFYAKAIELSKNQEFKKEIDKVFKIVGIATVVHNNDDLGTAYDEMIKLLEAKKTCPYIEYYNAPLNYYITNSYWRSVRKALNMYSPNDLIAIIMAVYLQKMLWVANVYEKTGRYILRNDLERWLSIYLNKEKKKSIVVIDVLMIAVPNLIC